MAAASVVGMEEMKFQYFSSINSMARKIMEEREKVKEKFGASWNEMSPSEQDAAIDGAMVDPQARARYAMHRVEREEVPCYPRLALHTGQKVVHFGDEDITWQDEHSSPFSWETRSQMEFSLTSAPLPEQGSYSLQADSKSSKAPQASQPAKVSQVSKVSNGESAVLGRKEEESSFWKISAERSKLEGEQADFHSLTPSQIKSLEKGEKPLPSYLRPESSSRETEEPPRVAKPRTQKPPAPPPPVAISVPPAPLSVSSTVAGWERSQSTLPSISTLPSVSTLDDVFTPGPATKSPSPSGLEKAESPLASSPSFSQFNTSSSVLKTGFDFLDNW
ncbi:uncharacterized protein C1orf198 homolog [Scleropages formosus]|uniref:Chromosome 1 open reading frame 198 n=1 Tax=Scleropages formosus TaxID=113540 RepID=A0A8C9TF52_SCLFO|nr:uncharacterized protein C1orf198 homolog [Scleropages formosus]